MGQNHLCNLARVENICTHRQRVVLWLVKAVDLSELYRSTAHIGTLDSDG